MRGPNSLKVQPAKQQLRKYAKHNCNRRYHDHSASETCGKMNSCTGPSLKYMACINLK
jgi:hypothetical protein